VSTIFPLQLRISKILKRFSRQLEYSKDGIRFYKPRKIHRPINLADVQPSAWRGLESIISDIIQQSNISPKRCLEFGVEFGYSTSAFANYFEEVIGVDLFTGDPHAGFKGDVYQLAKQNLASFPNVRLVQQGYADYILGNDETFDLIHVDIIHSFEDTYACGIWSARHSACTLFHDTDSYPDVRRAVLRIAKETGKQFYNYPHCNGLGILF